MFASNLLRILTFTKASKNLALIFLISELKRLILEFKNYSICISGIPKLYRFYIYLFHVAHIICYGICCLFCLLYAYKRGLSVSYSKVITISMYAERMNVHTSTALSSDCTTNRVHAVHAERGAERRRVVPAVGAADAPVRRAAGVRARARARRLAEEPAHCPTRHAGSRCN